MGRPLNHQAAQTTTPILGSTDFSGHRTVFLSTTRNVMSYSTFHNETVAVGLPRRPDPDTHLDLQLNSDRIL